MATRFTCPECGKILRAQIDTVARKVRCPACRAIFLPEPWEEHGPPPVPSQKTRFFAESEEEAERDTSPAVPSWTTLFANRWVIGTAAVCILALGILIGFLAAPRKETLDPIERQLVESWRRERPHVTSPEVAEFMKGIVEGYTDSLEESKINTAKIKVKVLSDAVDTYYVKFGEYPPSLDALLQPDSDTGKAILENAEALKTPWGKSVYAYDATGPHNRNGKPDIWAQAPNGKLIGNWPDGQ